MLEAYGLAAAHLSEWQRRRDEERARYDRGLATVAVRRPGVISGLAMLFRQVLRNRAARSAAAAEENRTTTSCGGCVSPTRIAA
jgi:hypothetical protein